MTIICLICGKGHAPCRLSIWLAQLVREHAECYIEWKQWEETAKAIAETKARLIKVAGTW